MRRAVLVLLAVSVLPACVPMGEFTALRDEVRQVQADNKRLREADADMRRRLDEQDRALKSAEPATRLEALERRLAELKRQSDETGQRLDTVSAKLEEGDLKPRAKTPVHDPKTDFPVGKPAKAEGLEAAAVLTPTAAYNQAYNDYLKGNYDLAMAGFESFLKQFPSTSLSAHAQYWIGEASYNKKEYKAAIEAFDRVINEKKYEKSDRLAPALYKSGLAHVALGDVVKARSFFKRVVEEHPQSNEAPLARLRLADPR
jgi:tol-pal system protein YbgF